jgi:hypothetical protein
MKLRSIALVVTLALASAAAHAQAGVFLTFNTQQFTQSGIYANPGTHGNVDKPWLFGPGYGVYVDFTQIPKLKTLKTGPVVLGFDGRGQTLRLSEYGSTLNRQDGIFSLRASLKKPVMGSTVYAIGGFGIGHTKIPFKTYYSNNFVYQFGFGADRKIHKNVDWRVVEATAGFLGDYVVGYGPSANQSNYLITLGTGLVFRLK